MKKEIVLERMKAEFDALVEWISNHPDEKFEYAPEEGKWTTGQHISHLLKSAEALNQLMGLPPATLEAQFGKMNRPERDFDTLRTRYMGRLTTAKPIPASPFRTGVIPVADKPQLIADLEAAQNKLLTLMDRWEDADMSVYIVPHPLLGKLSIREMGHFFAFHTADHIHTLQTKYA